MQAVMVADLNINGSTDHNINGRIRQNNDTVFSVMKSIVGKLRNIIVLWEIIPDLEVIVLWDGNI